MLCWTQELFTTQNTCINDSVLEKVYGANNPQGSQGARRDFSILIKENLALSFLLAVELPLLIWKLRIDSKGHVMVSMLRSYFLQTEHSSMSFLTHLNHFQALWSREEGGEGRIV